MPQQAQRYGGAFRTGECQHGAQIGCNRHQQLRSLPLQGAGRRLGVHVDGGGQLGR